MRPIRAAHVNGRGGPQRINRDAIILRQNGYAAGADLVGKVAVGGNAVTAHKAGLHPAVFHHHRGHVVADKGHIHPRPLQFIAGEPGALQKRTGLVGEYLHPHATLRR